MKIFPLQYDRLLNQQQKNNQTKQLQKCADEIQTLPSMLHENICIGDLAAWLIRLGQCLNSSQNL